MKTMPNQFEDSESKKLQSNDVKLILDKLDLFMRKEFFWEK